MSIAAFEALYPPPDPLNIVSDDKECRLRISVWHIIRRYEVTSILGQQLHPSIEFPSIKQRCLTIQEVFDDLPIYSH
jgi:hypothetical protein